MQHSDKLSPQRADELRLQRKIGNQEELLNLEDWLIRGCDQASARPPEVFPWLSVVVVVISLDLQTQTRSRLSDQ